MANGACPPFEKIALSKHVLWSRVEDVIAYRGTLRFLSTCAEDTHWGDMLLVPTAYARLPSKPPNVRKCVCASNKCTEERT